MRVANLISFSCTSLRLDLNSLSVAHGQNFQYPTVAGIRSKRGKNEHTGVHQDPSGSSQEWVGKPRGWLSDRYLTVALHESAGEFVLREGFSKEHGARNLERLMDRLIDTLVAGALPGGKITAGRTIHLEAVDGRIQFGEVLSP